jgi:hypothetical protein
MYREARLVVDTTEGDVQQVGRLGGLWRRFARGRMPSGAFRAAVWPSYGCLW